MNKCTFLSPTAKRKQNIVIKKLKQLDQERKFLQRPDARICSACAYFGTLPEDYQNFPEQLD